MIKRTLRNFGKALVRRKYFTEETVTQSKLQRCLTTFDLTFLGVGSTLGLGIYVLAGQAASTKAGPSVIISFLVAAIASIFSALCYAEFGARVPKAGSAYVYSYVTVGEFMAFIIGWNIVLEYVIGIASVARGYSGYLDYLVNGTIQKNLEHYMPIKVGGMSSYPDFLALGITLLLTIMLAWGVKESTRFNNIFTSLNLCVVLYAVITGIFKADIHNWQLRPEEVPPDFGVGGFFPFGFSGMMAGAAMCFYGYVGFDCIATTGEEVKNPQKAIPMSIIVSLFIVFLAYFGISTIQTLLWPYYDQNVSAPLPYVFEMVDWNVAKWIISVGALAGLSTSLLGAMFPLPRILYAMASDGLIFRFLADIHPKFHTPLIATIISGIFAGIMAMMFDVHELASMMSIGTLLAYTLVCISVLILRYRVLDERIHLSAILQPTPSAPDMQTSSIVTETSVCSPSSSQYSPPTGTLGVPPHMYNSASLLSQNTSMNASITTMLSSGRHYTAKDYLKMVFNWESATVQNAMTSMISIYLIWAITFLLFVLNCLIVFLQNELLASNEFVIAPVCFVLLLVAVSVFGLYCQPSDNQSLTFRVPYVPLVPVLSIFINFNLVLNLSVRTWYRFAVWMVIGFFIYFGYGIRNSSENARTVPVLPSIYETMSDTEDESKRTEKSPLLSDS